MVKPAFHLSPTQIQDILDVSDTRPFNETHNDFLRRINGCSYLSIRKDEKGGGFSFGKQTKQGQKKGQKNPYMDNFIHETLWPLSAIYVFYPKMKRAFHILSINHPQKLLSPFINKAIDMVRKDLYLHKIPQIAPSFP